MNSVKVLSIVFVLCGTIVSSEGELNTLTSQTVTVENVSIVDGKKTELELKKRSTLHDLDSAILFFQRKIISLEKLLTSMNLVLNSIRKDDTDSSLDHTLEVIIEYNIMKLEQVKKDLSIQLELDAFVKSNLEDFLVVSSEVGKAMSARYE